KVKTLFIAHSAQDARGVIYKAQAVEDANDSLLEVVDAAPEIEQFSPAIWVEAERQGVDGEITAVEVELDAAVLDRGEDAGRRVKLRARSDEVQVGGQVVDCAFSLQVCQQFMGIYG